MIILDTNVVSEMFRPRPDVKAMNWLRGQRKERLFLTAISLAELRYGVELLSPGKRRDQLDLAMRRMVAGFFDDRVLPFDMDAAETYAPLRAGLRREGRSIQPLDVMIASIARVHGAAVATRNTADFEFSGIPLQNPFEGPAP